VLIENSGNVLLLNLSHHRTHFQFILLHSAPRGKTSYAAALLRHSFAKTPAIRRAFSEFYWISTKGQQIAMRAAVSTTCATFSADFATDRHENRE
jgi:hypothetical protein